MPTGGLGDWAQIAGPRDWETALYGELRRKSDFPGFLHRISLGFPRILSDFDLDLILILIWLDFDLILVRI